jgi:two-component sensor histidine kinase
VADREAACESARGPDADRHVKLLIQFAVEGSLSGAYSHEAADNLQKLILEELHHRIKNTLATVGAIASQSVRNAPSVEHAQHAIEGRLLALGRAHDLLLKARWTSADLGQIVRGATEAFDNPDASKFSIQGPNIRIALPPGPRLRQSNIGASTSEGLKPNLKEGPIVA